MSVHFTEGFAPVVEDLDLKRPGIIKQLAIEILASQNSNWSLHFPQSTNDITNLFVIKYTLRKDEVTRDVLIEFYRPLYVEKLSEDKKTVTQDTNKSNYYYCEVVFGTGQYTPPNNDSDRDANGNYKVRGSFEEDKSSVRSRFSWFRSNTSSVIKKWLPVYYWVSVNSERITIILSGDKSANSKDRLISFGYIGKVKPFKDSESQELGNFGVTVSSDLVPGDYLTLEEITRFSDKTGTGVTDICMLETYTGYPMQAHYASFTTPDEFVDKKLEGPSAYTKKYHMSPVYVFHSYDGYRGELYGVVACDRSTVVHMDDLIHKYDALEANIDSYVISDEQPDENPVKGQIYLDSGDARVYEFNGTDWVVIKSYQEGERVFNLDRTKIYKVINDNGLKLDEGKSPVGLQLQDIYKVYLVSAPYSVLNNATNVMYGLAMLKSAFEDVPV